MARHDYIVVGSGSAGAIVAARLSEDPDCRVLVLEAGPHYASMDVTPDDLLRAPLSLVDHDWGWVAEAMPGRTIPYPRGKVTGGCSAVNGAIALRGDPEDFDEWVARGLDEWSFADVLPFFRALEDDPVGAALDPEVHGVGGPLPIRRVPAGDWQPFHAALWQAALEAGFPACADLAAPGATGVGVLPRNQIDGVRISTSLAYLTGCRERSNLEIRPNATVDSLVIEGGRVRGVRAIVDGTQERLEADQVVLAGGALGTPAILMRSGIGPSMVLKEAGVDVVCELQGVGSALLDHPTAALTGAPQPGVQHDPSVAVQVAMRYTSEGSPDPNDLQLCLSTLLDPDEVARMLPGGEPVFILLTVLMKPHGAGRLTITSADPTVQPRVELGYLAHPDDTRRLVEGLRLSARLAKSQHLAPFIGSMHVSDEVLADDSSAAAYLSQVVGTCYHPAGTCPMGPDDDPRAVVDGHGRLYGVEGVRVVDASVMPTIVRSNINVTCMAVAERMAAWMRAGQ